MSVIDVRPRSQAGDVSVGVAETSPLAADALVAALRAAGMAASAVSSDSDLDLDDVDVVLADSGLAPDLLARLAAGVAGRPECRLVLVSSRNTSALRQTMRHVGAVTTFERSRNIDELVVTVRDVARGAVPVPRAETRGQNGPCSLTSREMQILEIIAGGATNDNVAAALGISPHTVRSHLGNILGKLGVTGRLGAVAAVRQAGLLPQPRTTAR